MPDESPLPGWRCLVDEGDLYLVQAMLENHGVHAEIAPVSGTSKYSHAGLWVRSTDYERAVALVERMSAALTSTASGSPWRCEFCGEENEPQFDICWNCNRDLSGAIADAHSPAEAVPAEPADVSDHVEESVDERVLRELEEAGADLSQPRSIVHFLYVPTAEARTAVAASLKGSGYGVEEREADAKDAPHPLLIVARTHGIADANTIGQARRFFELLAGMYRGDYDGWEASVEP